MLNGLVLLPVLLSIMGPPAEAPVDDDASRRPVPSPEPPPMTHHRHYKSHHSAQSSSCKQAFSEYSEYSEGPRSGITEDHKSCGSNQYSPTSDILLEASKNPSFPKLKVSCNRTPSCLSVFC